MIQKRISLFKSISGFSHVFGVIVFVGIAAAIAIPAYLTFSGPPSAPPVAITIDLVYSYDETENVSQLRIRHIGGETITDAYLSIEETQIWRNLEVIITDPTGSKVHVLQSISGSQIFESSSFIDAEYSGDILGTEISIVYVPAAQVIWAEEIV
jgi:hypothetical protein